MSSIGVALPIEKDSVDGFAMLKGIRDTVKQNLKMLVLTNPGERVMEPEFGVGIKRYLFQNFSENIQSDIKQRVTRQVAIYMPAVRIDSVNFLGSNPDTNSLSMSIIYSIPDIGVKDLLEFTI